MNNTSRILVIAAAVMLIGSYFFPIWEIDLEAPQYPEGIGLRIWLNKITGANDYDLENINKLNHYIGMQTIEPESIPELSVMPYIVVFLIIFGLAAGLSRKKSVVAIWAVLIIVLLMVGIYDFYIWGYDYGHNLDTNAPIKVPGMAYQPPLIGSKQLLNMYSTSLPGLGSFFLGLPVAVGAYVLLEEKIKKVFRRKKK